MSHSLSIFGTFININDVPKFPRVTGDTWDLSPSLLPAVFPTVHEFCISNSWKATSAVWNLWLSSSNWISDNLINNYKRTTFSQSPLEWNTNICEVGTQPFPCTCSLRGNLCGGGMNRRLSPTPRPPSARGGQRGLNVQWLFCHWTLVTHPSFQSLIRKARDVGLMKMLKANQQHQVDIKIITTR